MVCVLSYQVLGRGSFGKVMMAKHKVSGEIYAIKALKKEVVVEVRSGQGKRGNCQLSSCSKSSLPFFASYDSSLRMTKWNAP